MKKEVHPMMMTDKVTILIPSYQPNTHLIRLAHTLADLGFRHVIIVDDGSSDAKQHYFEEAAARGATILHHETNHGKGAAIKTGIRTAAELYPEDYGIVTADGDGQHLPEDILKVADALAQHPDSLVLGVREFRRGETPWKSYCGNRITSAFFKASTGVRLKDTQTGLRGIPKALYATALSTEGDRYEYEMHFLEDTVKEVPHIQIPIETVYEDNNAGSHFRPIRDSARVYARPLRFVTSSLTSSLLDLLLFWILMQILPMYTAIAISTATVIARVISSIFNYNLNRVWCFKSRENVARSGFRYILLLLVQTGMSAGFVTLLSTILSATLIAKIIVDVSLSVFSYYAQKHWVFRKKEVRHEPLQRSIQPTA